LLDRDPVLTGGLIILKTPLGAAEGSQAEGHLSTTRLQATPTSSYPLFFPLLFKDGQPALPGVP
jgi:hypothetical protein